MSLFHGAFIGFVRGRPILSREPYIAVLDKSAIEIEFAKNNFSDYSYAEFKFEQKIGNYYGMSKKSVHFALYPQLNNALQKMASAGRVAEIYRKHGIEPPLQ